MSATNNSTQAFSNQDVFLRFFAGIILRLIAILATIMNIGVLVLLIRLKIKFRNYSYWFQIMVLSSEDLFNGLSSLALTFFDLELFRTSAVACSVILCAYMCSQMNTLLGICCICINRFKSIRSIDKIRDPNVRYQQEISVAIVAIISIAYSLMPFLVFPLNNTLPACSIPNLLNPNNARTYKLLTSFGLIIPLAIIDVLYSICLVKLRHVNVKIKPTIGQEGTHMTEIGSVPVTEETMDGVSRRTENQPKTGGATISSGSILYESCKTSTVTHEQRTPIEECSIATTTCPDTTGTNRLDQTRGTLSRARASTIETQSRAIKLLGIILLTTNITVMIPVVLLLRDTIRAQSDTGGSAMGVTLLALNALIDAFVYGFYAVEIRKYVYGKIVLIGRLICSR